MTYTKRGTVSEVTEAVNLIHPNAGRPWRRPREVTA